MKRFDSGIRSTPLRRLFTAALCLGAAVSFPARAAAQASGGEGFTEATDVVAVEVPVQVTRDGQPVRGLTAADFQIYEGKKTQPITGFEVLDLATLEAGPGELKLAKAKVPPAARRRFLLLFDMSFSDNAALTKARDAAKDMVRTSFHPTDLIGVATYRRSRGPELLLGFTSDRRQVEDALNKLGAMERAADPLRLVSGPPYGLGGIELLTSGAIDMGGPGSRRTEREDGGEPGSGSGEATSTVSIGSIPNTGELRRAADKQSGMDQEMREVIGFSRSLADFSKMLGSIQGRKYVIFLSEGFNGQLLTGTQDDTQTQLMNDSTERGAYWNINSDDRYGNTRVSNDVENMLEELRRADCVIHSVDIGGLRAFGGEAGVKPAAGGQESLFIMAESTGGEMLRNFNNLSEAMGKVLERTSVTYVLTYQPDGVKHDGAYRKLRVELKNAPRGTRVSFRPGYYAPKPYAQRSGLEKAIDAASQLVNGREGGAITASVLAAPFAAASGERAYVPVLIEVDGKGLVGGKAGPALPIEIYAYAMDAAGEVQDYFAKTLGFDLAKVGPALQQSGLKFYGDLWLPPGSYSLRVLVRNSESGASSLRVAALEVPAFGPSGQPVLLQPFFPEPPNRWLLVRESNEMPKNVSYPFMLQEQPYIPAVRPVLQAQQEVRISLVGYRLRPGDFKADSLVLTADGKEVGPGEVRLLDRRGGAEGSDRLSATFRPPALQPGEYLLLLTLTDSTGAVKSSATPFVIASAAAGAMR